MHHFDGLTATAFDDLAATTLGGLYDDPLHGFFASRGIVAVAWRLAFVVGAVARQHRANPECPSAWQQELILTWVFARLAERAKLGPQSDRGRSTTGFDLGLM